MSWDLPPRVATRQIRLPNLLRLRMVAAILSVLALKSETKFMETFVHD